MILAGRRVLTTAMSVIGTVIIARALGVASFGQLSSALAAYWLAASVSDFGFSLVLGRDLAAHPDGRGRMLRASFQVGVLWSLVPAAALVVLAVASGVTTTRGLVLLVLAPATAFGGLTGARQVFLALYRTRRLAAIDLTVNALQLVAIVLIAAFGGGAVGVAIALSACAIANDSLTAIAALPLVDSGRAGRIDRVVLLRRALPLGLVSVMSSAYFTVDLILLGWLVSGLQLGPYAAAVKVLSLLVVVPGMLMSAALPAVASSVPDPVALRALAMRLLHWLAAVGLPACVGAAIFAGPLVRMAFGSGYGAAVPLVRILSAAAAITLLTNLLGTLLIARSIVRPMIIQNAAAIVFNVAGNVVLAPRYGVIASAWLTVATELIVCGGALYLLRGSLGLGSVIGAGLRPAVAVAGLAATGLALSSWPTLGVPAAIGVFLVLLGTLGAWPVELQPFRRRGGGS
jgi:O-antigen/teichoic acid export membrane protein